MSEDMKWTEEVDDRLDALEARTDRLGKSTMFLGGASICLGVGLAVSSIAIVRLVKGFNQIVPPVNQLIELASQGASTAVKPPPPVPMPPVAGSPEHQGYMRVPSNHFQDGTPEAPVQDGWDPGERETPESVRTALADLSGLEQLFDEPIVGGETLPSTEGLPDPRQ